LSSGNDLSLTGRIAASALLGGHRGERPNDKQSREEETEGKQEEGRAFGFTLCFNRSGEAQQKRRSKENPVTTAIVAGASSDVSALAQLLTVVASAVLAHLGARWAREHSTRAYQRRLRCAGGVRNLLEKEPVKDAWVLPKV
jgi:hypothetical protein